MNQDLARATVVIAGTSIGTEERISRAAEALRTWPVTIRGAGYFEMLARAMLAQFEHDSGDSSLSPIKYYKKMTSTGDI